MKSQTICVNRIKCVVLHQQSTQSSPFQSRQSPGTSPLQPERHGDRFIPHRTPSRWRINFDLGQERNFGRDKVKKAKDEQPNANQQSGTFW